jgi:hypothetical protein
MAALIINGLFSVSVAFANNANAANQLFFWSWENEFNFLDYL